MPRKLIDVNELWLERIQNVIPLAIDTLQGLEAQILRSQLLGEPDPIDLIDNLSHQINTLRRNLESVRIIF